MVSIICHRNVSCGALRRKEKASNAAPIETSIEDVEREVAAAAAAGDQQQEQQQQKAQQLQAPVEATAQAGQQQQQQQQRSTAPAAQPQAAVPPTQTVASAALPSGLPVFLGVLLAASAALLLAYRRTLSTAAQSAITAGADALGSGLQQKKLQREAAARLNELSSTLQNSPSADLSAKNLGDEGAAYVVEALAFNTTCLAANLSNNGIGRVGVAQLCEVLPTCRLETLVLSTNSVGDEGAELLAQKLSGNAHLLTLDLGSNGIGDAGAAALAEGLKLNTTLTKLDLRWGGGGR